MEEKTPRPQGGGKRSCLEGCGWFFFLFIVCPLLYLILGSHSRANQSGEAARITTAALEQYRLKTGDYPANLADLVPGTLDRVPRGIMAYQVDKGQYSFLFTCDGLILFPWEDWYSRAWLKANHPGWFPVGSP